MLPNSHSLIHPPVRCSDRCVKWVLAGHQLGNGASCYSCSDDEHLFPVTKRSTTDAHECNLEGMSFGNNMVAVGKIFMHHFRFWLSSSVTLKLSIQHPTESISFHWRPTGFICVFKEQFKFQNQKMHILPLSYRAVIHQGYLVLVAKFWRY